MRDTIFNRYVNDSFPISNKDKKKSEEKTPVILCCKFYCPSRTI